MTCRRFRRYPGGNTAPVLDPPGYAEEEGRIGGEGAHDFGDVGGARLVLPVPEVVVRGQFFEKGNNPVLRAPFNLADFAHNTSDYEIGKMRARERSRSMEISAPVSSSCEN